VTWTTSEIRAARQTPLAPLLRGRGLTLQARPGENFLVLEHDDLLVKHGFWRWPSRGLHGNAIDYFMRVQGQTFHQAMQTLATARDRPADRSTLPSLASIANPERNRTPHPDIV
jgi:hypothetical protein